MERVIKTDVLFDLLIVNGTLTEENKQALLTRFAGQLELPLPYASRIMAASMMGLIEPDGLVRYLPALDRVNAGILAALCGTGPETAPEYLEWQCDEMAVARYSLRPHAECLRMIVLHSFERPEQVTAQ